MDGSEPGRHLYVYRFVFQPFEAANYCETGKIHQVLLKKGPGEQFPDPFPIDIKNINYFLVLTSFQVLTGTPFTFSWAI